MRANGNAQYMQAQRLSTCSHGTIFHQGETNLDNEKDKSRNWPIHVVKDGAVEAAIWERTDQRTGETRHQVSLSRSYQNKEGTWARTSTFDSRQLASVNKVTEQAHTWVLERTREL